MPQFTAHFDGKNLCPDEPISLPQGVKLRVTAEPWEQSAMVDGPSEDSQAWEDFFDLVDRCQVQTGISDLAHQHEHYLYGVPKQS